MNYKKVLRKKKRWWAEIKSLEQQYKRNLDDIEVLEEHQSDISFTVKKILDKIQELGEKYDNFCYENKPLDTDFMDALEDLANSKINNKPTKERCKK